MVTNGVAPIENVQLYSRISRIAASGSQTSWSTVPAPTRAGSSTPEFSPVLCMTGDGMKQRSAGPTPRPRRIVRAQAENVLNECWAPFGRDVVPDVNKMTCRWPESGHGPP